MNYESDIGDPENLGDLLILEHAEGDSIFLNYLGGDDRTQPIVGNEFSFSMEVLNGLDGKYIQYFTSNEQKWLVEKVIFNEQDGPKDLVYTEKNGGSSSG